MGTAGLLKKPHSRLFFADEQIESIDQPMSDEQIQALIDWTQQLWLSDPNIREMVSVEDYNRILESLKEQLNE